MDPPTFGDTIMWDMYRGPFAIGHLSSLQTFKFLLMIGMPSKETVAARFIWVAAADMSPLKLMVTVSPGTILLGDQEYLRFVRMAAAVEQSVTTGTPSPANTAAAAAVKAPEKLAAIQILTGPSAGKELELTKNLTTLGKPGVQVAVITRRPHGYFITHVEGANFPVINGKALDAQAHQLNDHDVVELAGVKMEFFFKNG